MTTDTTKVVGVGPALNPESRPLNPSQQSPIVTAWKPRALALLDRMPVGKPISAADGALLIPEFIGDDIAGTPKAAAVACQVFVGMITKSAKDTGCRWLVTADKSFTPQRWVKVLKPGEGEVGKTEERKARIYWRRKGFSEVGKPGEPMPVSKAEQQVKILNADHPELSHWYQLEPWVRG